MIRQFDTAVPPESETKPMTSPPFWSTATDELRRADPALGRIIDALPGEALSAREDAFYTLARSIVGQQISTRAAARGRPLRSSTWPVRCRMSPPARRPQ